MTNENSDVLDNHQYPPSEDNTIQQDTSVHAEPPECRYPKSDAVHQIDLFPTMMDK